ncbi:AcaB family transcriptional regulator [Cupriavidus sp. WS]|uniref:AcaB family transcriptional regulator n=1 Tax=Cupriavidus sp. WS TaxID=1312922 RepID=UPI0012DE628A|nr:AcaB family transcriptional regulator [Cupriavidus sp. WS]
MLEDPIAVRSESERDHDVDGRGSGQVAGDAPPKDGGLRTIERFNSDDRIARIVPDTAAGATATYYSTFARDFLDANFYYCSAKFSVGRGGKVKALDLAFREAEDWFESSLADWEVRNQIQFAVASREIPVKITHPLAGRLLRLIRQYDRLFSISLFCSAARSVSGTEREQVLSAAARQISRIHRLCIPDNDKYAPDGSRLPTPTNPDTTEKTA